MLRSMSANTLVNYDPWLEPYAAAIAAREEYIADKSAEILDDQPPADFASGHLHFGLHRTDDGWVFREWAPSATRIVMVGDFSDWNERPEYELQSTEHGQWELRLPAKSLTHGDTYKLRIYWDGGDGWRLPSYTTYAVQDPETHDFSAVVWHPAEDYQWKHQSPAAPNVPLIYEAHIGMSSEDETVSTYTEFTRDILPRIKRAGYNTIQLMAIPEHPYYGSFGYHVSNFYAASSRFGTPDEFKRLVDTAHGMGLRVILDLVHSHAARNESEGLSRFDGTLDQYFHPGDRGNHPAWDSRVFDYGKPQVMHFLLSNCRWWLDEYHVDGYRFDGVTSMIYTHHGLEKSFTSYDDYYGDDVDPDALTYLRLANQVIHDIRPDATTVAEEMSGLPGIGAPVDHGGLGFDYRLQMGAPDLWIKTLKERDDEDWPLGDLVHTLSSHRPEERVITYAESHDQALVGDKTLIFRLIDQAMYWHMQKSDDNIEVERGIALHKMIRLLTASTHGGGYLNFMGNEFGHPEWIDFPREGNDWSYQHARRQWSLVDNDKLQYAWLGEFDRAMTQIIATTSQPGLHYVSIDESRDTVSYVRDDHVFLFNFSPHMSLTNNPVHVPAGTYKVVLSTDDSQFGGQQRISHQTLHLSEKNGDQHHIRTYMPARTAIVLRRLK